MHVHAPISSFVCSVLLETCCLEHNFVWNSKPHLFVPVSGLASYSIWVLCIGTLLRVMWLNIILCFCVLATMFILSCIFLPLWSKCFHLWYRQILYRFCFHGKYVTSYLHSHKCETQNKMCYFDLVSQIGNANQNILWFGPLRWEISCNQNSLNFNWRSLPLNMHTLTGWVEYYFMHSIYFLINHLINW